MLIKRLGLFLLLVTVGYLDIFAQPASKNLSLVSQLDYEKELTDVWGYADDNNKEYALIGLTNGVSIVDLSTPTQPVERAFLPGIVSSSRDIKTYANYAYVSNESGDGIRIIDLSGLPGPVTFKDTLLAGIKTAHNVFVDNGFLYVVGTDTFNGGMAIFDVQADPMNPAFTGVYDLRYVHDVYVRNNLAYTAEISDRRMSIVDVTNKSLPELIGQVTYPGAFTHNTWLNEAGTVCFTTDEYGGAYIRAWDVSDPAKIKELDRIRSSLSQGKAIPHNVHALDGYLISSYYRDGIHLTDISRPHNMIEVGYYDTSDTLDGKGFNGNWGAYPFLPSGLILASDIENGLFVLSPVYQRGCYLEGQVRDLHSGQGLEEVLVEILQENIQDLSIPGGSYATGIGQQGTYRVAFSKFGYEPDTLTVSLINGQLTSVDVELVSLRRTKLKIELRDQATGILIPDAQVQAIAQGSESKFDYLSNSLGIVDEPELVIHPYQLIVGKWGYISQTAFINPSENDTSITFLLEKGYYDDFSLRFGWTVNSTATKGNWEIAEPDGVYRDGVIYAPEFDLPDDIGDKAFVTDNQDDGPYGYDVDRGYTILCSPWMDLSGYLEPVINYSYWFVNWSRRNGSQNQGPGNDFLSASITDGIDTIEIKRYIGPFDTTWTQESRFFFQKYFDITTTPLKILFYTQDFEIDNQDVVEAGIDGFRVIETATTPLPPELPENLSFNLYPVPFRNQLTLDIDFPPSQGPNILYSFELVDMLGKKVLSYPLSQSSPGYTWNLDLPSGLYLAQILKNGRIVAVKKIVK